MQWLEQRRIGETLRAGVEDGALVELHLARASDPLPFGAVTEAIVLGKNGARSRVECQDSDAWLIGSPQHPIGKKLPVQVVRAATPEPGQIKRAHVVEHRGLVQVPIEAQNVQDFPDSFEVEEWIDRAVSGTVLFGGGSLSLERTRAGLVIDVDGTGGTQALNIAAAQSIAAVLRLFQLGGMVMVDFITADNRRDRLELDAALDAALRKDPRPFERTAINGFGMVQIVRAKRGPSLIDQLCGTRRHAPSLETQSLRLLNDAVCSKGAGLRTLVARAEIIDQIAKWPQHLAALRLDVAADVVLTVDGDAPGHGFVHVTPV
jgi:ribonuclease G